MRKYKDQLFFLDLDQLCTHSSSSSSPTLSSHIRAVLQTMRPRGMKVWAHAVASVVALLFLFLSPTVTDAHTWLFSNGRSKMQASTTKPFKHRGDAASGSQTHAQFGPNQHMVVRWASSHNNTFSLVRLPNPHPDKQVQQASLHV